MAHFVRRSVALRAPAGPGLAPPLSVTPEIVYLLTGLHHDVIVLQSAVDSWDTHVYQAARVLIVTPSVFSESVFVMKTSLRRTRDVVSFACIH